MSEFDQAALKKKARDFTDRLRARIDELVNDPDQAALKKKSTILPTI
jgi:hypothetical protein